MKVSFIVDLPDRAELARTGVVPSGGEIVVGEVRLTFKDAIGHAWFGSWFARDGAFVATAGDSVAELIALRVVQELKRLAGEAPLDPAAVDLRGGKAQ
jgi:hypothetical protein